MFESFLFVDAGLAERGMVVCRRFLVGTACRRATGFVFVEENGKGRV